MKTRAIENLISAVLLHNPKLTEPQLKLLRQLPDQPSDGLRCRGGQKATAQALVAKGLAKLVGASGSWPSIEFYARTPEGKARAE